MASKQKKRLKQEERDIKAMHGIISGRVKVSAPENANKNKRTQSNRLGGAASVDEQGEMAAHYVRLLRMLLPGILAELSGLEDARDPRKIKHSLPALMLYGILVFLCQMPSRRAANREVGGSRLPELMAEFVPEFKTIPHADTLERLLSHIDTEEMEASYEGIVKGFIKSDQLNKINPGRFIVALDGTQKFSRSWCWDSRAQSRNAGDPDKERYFSYMVESVLILENGMVLPLLTETMENGESLDGDGKQDCES